MTQIMSTRSCCSSIFIAAYSILSSITWPQKITQSLHQQKSALRRRRHQRLLNEQHCACMSIVSAANALKNPLSMCARAWDATASVAGPASAVYPVRGAS